MQTPRLIYVFLLALLLSASAGADADGSDTYVQGLQDSLIAYSASDFANGEPRPDGFRKVDLRYLENDHGARNYMLCGQLRKGTGTAVDWVDFATIKTAGYENWIGSAATDLCTRGVRISPEGSDLSSVLQTAVDHAQHQGTPKE